MKIGAIYIITQDSRYRELLLNSAASLKRAMPDLPITVFSQFPLESANFERVIRVEGSQDGFYDKTLFFQQTPYERTLFIDADTYIVEPVPELFTMLDQFDFAATHEEYLNTDWWNRYPRPDICLLYTSLPKVRVGWRRRLVRSRAEALGKTGHEPRASSNIATDCSKLVARSPRLFFFIPCRR